jgi:hypothetical protein
MLGHTRWRMNLMDNNKTVAMSGPIIFTFMLGILCVTALCSLVQSKANVWYLIDRSFFDGNVDVAWTVLVLTETCMAMMAFGCAIGMVIMRRWAAYLYFALYLACLSMSWFWGHGANANNYLATTAWTIPTMMLIWMVATMHEMK